MKASIYLSFFCFIFFSCKENNLHSPPQITVSNLTHIVNEKEIDQSSTTAFVEKGQSILIDFNVTSIEKLDQINVYATENETADLSEFSDGLYGETYKRVFDSDKEDNFTISIQDIQSPCIFTVSATDDQGLSNALNYPIEIVEISAVYMNKQLDSNAYYSVKDQMCYFSSDTGKINDQVEFSFDGQKLINTNLSNGITTYFSKSENDTISALDLAYIQLPIENTSILVEEDQKYFFESSNNKKGYLHIQKIENQNLLFDIYLLNHLK